MTQYTKSQQIHKKRAVKSTISLIIARQRQECDARCECDLFFVLLALSTFKRSRLSLLAAGDKDERGEIGESPKTLPGRRTACMLTADCGACRQHQHSPLSSLFLKQKCASSSLPWGMRNEPMS
jgi:hypothetical protein